MKKNFFGLAIALVALFNIDTATAQPNPNRHWVVDPTAECGVYQVSIKGKAAGLATGPVYARITGYYDCVNNGKNVPKSSNWSQLDVVVPVSSQETGGNLDITAILESLCDHANWTFKTKDLEVTLYATEADALAGTNALLGPTPIKPDCF